MIAGDRVRVTVTVAVEPAVAFEVFTTEIDRWWRRGPQFRAAGRSPGTLILEGRLGGRVFEQFADSVFETGTITTWEPPSRLAFEWRASNFAPGEVTLVEIAFDDLGDGRTQVELVHRGFAALRPDHPVRHGADATEFARRIGMWWGQLLTSFREIATYPK